MQELLGVNRGGYVVNSEYVRLYSNITGHFNPRYIADTLHYTKIDQYFNNRKYGWGVNDKNYYSLYFHDAKQPETVVRKIGGLFYSDDYHLITKRQAIEICKSHETLIIKPSTETGGSRGIVFWRKCEPIEELLEKCGNNIIVQKLIKQHKDLAVIHPSSVNTIRVMSLIWKGEVRVLSSVLRMGVCGSKVDNASAGGITCGIKENGQLKDVAFSAKGERFERHPQGFHFSNCKIPNYTRVIQMVRDCHERLGHFKLVSWDIAVGEDAEPILIEANLRNGELDFHQFNNGPIFGDLTEEILKEVVR